MSDKTLVKNSLETEGTKKPRLPGDPGVWVPITLDAFGFLILFTIFSIERIQDPITFELGRQSLNTGLAFANTLILLTSSMFVVRAIDAARAHVSAGVQRNLLIAILLGFSFLVLKVFGWAADTSIGHGITSSKFYGYYFGITGLHFVHVIVGMVALLICFNMARKRFEDEKFLMWLESAGSWWHMVDMLWVFIFPMIYLLKAVI